MLVQLPERAPEACIVASRESQLARLGEAPLAERDAVLGVAARREGEVGQRGEQWGGKGRLEPLPERGRDFRAEPLAHDDSVPQPAMREEVIVLTFVPGAIGQQGVSEQPEQPGW